jgi:uncharacterized membrane protein YwzB
MEELMKKVNLKQIGNIGIIISVALITFYGLQSVKTYLEIKKLKSEN